MDVINYRLQLKKQLANLGPGRILLELNNAVDGNSAIFNEVVSLTRSFNSIKAQERGKLKSDEVLAREMRQLNHSILGVIDILEMEDIISAETDMDEDRKKAAAHFQEIPGSIFLSTPMASFKTDAEFQEMKNVSEEMQDVLSYELNFGHIYYAGNTIKDLTDFHTPEASVKQDFKAINSCEYFLLVYPGPIPTSALVEAGYAIAYNKKCVYFVKDRNHLPFLLRESDKVFSLQIVEYAQLKDIPQLLKKVKFTG